MANVHAGCQADRDLCDVMVTLIYWLSSKMKRVYYHGKMDLLAAKQKRTSILSWQDGLFC